MMSKSRMVDFLLLSIAAWAAIATSRKSDYAGQRVLTPVSATFAFESNCEDAVEKSGTLTISSENDPLTLTLESDYPVGLPGNTIIKASEIEKNGGLELTYTANDENRSCIAVIEESIFSYAGTTTFSCYDNDSEAVTCTVNLALILLKE